MRFSTTLTLMAALTTGRIAGAQTCTPPEHPFFEYQVATPARFVGDSGLRPRPASEREQRQDSSALVVSFVVDSLGLTDWRTLKILRTPSRAAADSVRAVLGSWRFSPAIVADCHVPQLVMTTVVR
jgi:hypothetical protein